MEPEKEYDRQIEIEKKLEALDKRIDALDTMASNCHTWQDAAMWRSTAGEQKWMTK